MSGKEQVVFKNARRPFDRTAVRPTPSSFQTLSPRHPLSPTVRSPRRRSAPTVLVVGLAAFFFFAFLLFALVLKARLAAVPPPPVPVSTRALDLVRPTALNPVRVLAWLADEEGERDLIQAALAQGDLDTAYALTLFAGNLSDTERVSLLVETANRMREVASYDATALYVIGSQAALLTPLVDSATRAQVMLEAGDGLLDLRRKDLALLAWQQASILARYDPHLPLTARARLLEALAERYERAGEPAHAAAAREPVTANVSENALPFTVLAEALISPPAEWPEDVLPYVEQRQRVARILGKQVETGEAPAWSLLEEALLAEGVAVRNWLAEPTDDPLGRLERYRRWIRQRRLIGLGVLGRGVLPRVEAEQAILDHTATALWWQQEASLDLMWSDMPETKRQLARQAWVERRLFVHLLGGSPNENVDELLHQLDVLNGQLAGQEARLVLVAQPDERTGLYFWRLPVAYLKGTLPPDVVFR